MVQSFYCYLVKTSADEAVLHMQGCTLLADRDHRIFLGSVYQSYQALSLARRRHPAVSLCQNCMQVVTPR